MENEKKNTEPIRDDQWLDEILGIKTPSAELSADEMAVTAAKLVHMDDMDLEKILAEDWSKVPDLEELENGQSPAKPASPEPAPKKAVPQKTKAAQAEQTQVLPKAAPKKTAAKPAAEDATQVLPKRTTKPAPKAAPSEDKTQVLPQAMPQKTVVLPQAEPEQPKEQTQSLEATQMFSGDLDHTQKFATPPDAKPDIATKKRRRKNSAEVEAASATRPRRKRGYGLLGIPHIICTAVVVFILVFIGTNSGDILWEGVADLMAFGKPDVEARITIEEGESIDSIAQKLADAQLIKYPELFKKFATLTGKDERIDPGTYDLTAKYDYNAMLKGMVDYGPARNEITVMIPEGYTCAQIFRLMEEKGVCSAKELEEYAANGELSDYWFLEGVERGSKYCLEGYLFPDTYNFYTNDTPRHVLEKFLEGFDLRFTDTMKDKLEALNTRLSKVLSNRGYGSSYIESHKLTYRDIVIIASMIEKETSGEDESYDISGVIFNRLTNPANFVYLNIDATLIYALDGNIDPETGLSKPLTSNDYKMDHPYNTYNEPGLPPGPISNPGRNSLDAALSPEDNGYYYYVYDPEAKEHLFSKTLKEHEQKTDRIYGGNR